jgi:hypothetical protein
MINLFSFVLSLILLEFVLQLAESQPQTNSLLFLLSLPLPLTHYKSDVTLHIIHLCHLIILAIRKTLSCHRRIIAQVCDPRCMWA